MITFESEEEVLEFLELMNLKAVDMIIDAIISSVVRVQMENGDVEPVKIGYEGFNKVFGGNNGNRKVENRDCKESSNNK